jgi:acyl dehydratase/putative sterol carrier protein
VQGQRIHAYEVQMNEGVEKVGAAPWTAQEIAQNLDSIFAFGAPPQAAKPAPAPAGPDPVEEVFSYAPQAYQGEKAGDWRAVIHFVISGGPDHTITVGDGKAAVARGLVGAPSCTFKTDRETILGILTQKIDPQKAFMKGRITADDLGVAMKFAMFFRFEKPAEAALPPTPAAAPAAPEPEPAPWSPPIGKTYHGGYALVEPAHLEAYAAATNDASLAYYGSDAIAPPMFHVRLLRDMMFAVVTDPELGLDVLRLVHGEYETISHRPLRPWDVVQLRARLEAVEQKAKGLIVVSRLYGLVNGEVAVEARSSYFIRGQIRLPIPASEGARPAPEPLPPPEGSLRIQVDADQSIRYAAASLDDNPIHLDPETARMAGLPDVILHGLCTMALSGRALLKAFAFEDPRQLKRLSVRFSKPVRNGSQLSLKVWRSGKELRFQVINAEGEAVITNGLAELR